MLGNREGWTCTHNDFLPSQGEKTAKAFFLALPFPKRVEKRGGSRRDRKEGGKAEGEIVLHHKDSALSAH